MVTFTCENKECSNFDIKFDFTGKEEFAECGGCKTTLKSKNYRKDPVIEYPPLTGVINEKE